MSLKLEAPVQNTLAGLQKLLAYRVYSMLHSHLGGLRCPLGAEQASTLFIECHMQMRVELRRRTLLKAFPEALARISE